MEFLGNYIYYITLMFIALSGSVFFYTTRGNSINILQRNKSWIFQLTGVVFALLWFDFAITALVKQSWNRLLMGDLCSAISFVAVVPLVTRNEKYLKAIFPWMLLGGLITMGGTSLDFSYSEAHFNINSYFKHSLYVALSIIGMLTVGKYTKSDYRNVYLSIAVYVLYILIVIGSIYWSTGIKKYGAFSTGLLSPSYERVSWIEHGKEVYTEDYKFFGDIAPYPYTTILFYGLSCGVVFLTCRYMPRVSKKSFD